MRAPRRRSLLPVVVFCFSKKRVDALAGSLTSLDLATTADKSDIQVRPPASVSLQPHLVRIHITV